MSHHPTAIALAIPQAPRGDTVELPVQEVSGFSLFLLFLVALVPSLIEQPTGGPHVRHPQEGRPRRGTKSRGAVGNTHNSTKYSASGATFGRTHRHRAAGAPPEPGHGSPEVPTHATTWTNPEDIAPSDKHCATALTPGTQSRQSHRDRKWAGGHQGGGRSHGE